MGRINLATKEALDANPALLTEHAERRPPRRDGDGPAAAATTGRAAARGTVGATTDRAAVPDPRGEMGDHFRETVERGDPAPGAG